MLSVGAYRRSQSSSGHHKSHLSNFNYYIKIGLVPAKPSRMTTFRTTLLFCDEVGSALSLGEATKVPCPSQVVLSDSTMNLQLAYQRIDCRISTD